MRVKKENKPIIRKLLFVEFLCHDVYLQGLKEESRRNPVRPGKKKKKKDLNLVIIVGNVLYGGKVGYF